VARHDATPNQIAIGPVIVVTNIAIGIVKGIAKGITISRTPKTETKPAATETTAVEATAMETTAVKSATATMTSTAMTSTAMGKGSRTGSAQQDSRCADNAKAANGEQSYGRQTARQDIAVASPVSEHRYSFPDPCTHRQFAKILASNRRFRVRRGSNHLNVILTKPDADRPSEHRDKRRIIITNKCRGRGFACLFIALRIAQEG
jgi:hypothetical protein